MTSTTLSRSFSELTAQDLQAAGEDRLADRVRQVRAGLAECEVAPARADRAVDLPLDRGLRRAVLRHEHRRPAGGALHRRHRNRVVHQAGAWFLAAAFSKSSFCQKSTALVVSISNSNR